MGRVIAIVEDSDNIAALELALSSVAGTSVIRMTDGESLMRALQSDSLDLAGIVTDLNLPFFDGFEILEAVRNNSRYRELPVIVITGDSRSEVRRRAGELGASAFFFKPYSPLEIRRTLEELICAT